MGTNAYILIEVQVGRATQIVRSLRLLDGVKSADIVTGPFDVIALIEAPNMAAVADLVTGLVQGIPRRVEDYYMRDGGVGSKGCRHAVYHYSPGFDWTILIPG